MNPIDRALRIEQGTRAEAPPWERTGQLSFDGCDRQGGRRPNSTSVKGILDGVAYTGKLALMDVAERWLRLAAQIDGAAAFPASRTCDAPELAPQVPIPCQPAAVGTAMVPK